MKFQRKRGRKVRAVLELTPLIDVVFQLLIFFMLSATFVVQTSIPIEMPKAEGAPKIDQKDVTITLAYNEGGMPSGPDGRGGVFINEEAITSMQELSQVLQAEVQDNPDLLVLIRSDARLDTGRLVEVMGIANSVGVRRYGIAAQAQDE
jgi:biopolymer transport protein ExbD